MLQLLKNLVVRHRFAFLVIASLSFAIVLPIFFFGIPSGTDLQQHYQFALTFRESLQTGSIYPSWSALSNHGFGDIGVRFYPPFSYYVMVFMELLTGSWFHASVLTIGIWFFVGGIGVYFWSQEWFDQRSSLFASVIYILAPYHVNQIYNASMYAEFASAAILPFCFLFVTRICRRNNLSDIFGLAISFALLILTHLPMTVIASLALLVYGLALLEKKSAIAVIIKLGIGVCLGLFASSFYWIRLVTELDFLNHATEVFSSDAYDYSKNFIPAFLYLPQTEYLEGSTWFADLMLLMTFFLSIPGALLFYFVGKGSNKPKLFGVIALFGFAIFIASPLSSPIWENFETLQKVQFPWRTLTVITLSGMIFTAAGFQYIAETLETKQRPLAILAIGLILAGIVFTGTQVIRPAIFIAPKDFAKKIDALPDAESYECWRTIWSKPEAFEVKEKVIARSRTVEIISWRSAQREFRVEKGGATNARIATFYYPHWRATVNDTPVKIEKVDDGTMLIPIPAAESKVSIVFTEPYFVRFFNIFSVGMWLILLAGFFAAESSRVKKENIGIE